MKISNDWYLVWLGVNTCPDSWITLEHATVERVDEVGAAWSPVIMYQG